MDLVGSVAACAGLEAVIMRMTMERRPGSGESSALSWRASERDWPRQARGQSSCVCTCAICSPVRLTRAEMVEPRVHREGNGHRPENRDRAPTRGTVFCVQVHPWQSPPVSPLRVSLPTAQGGYDVLGGARWLQVQFFGLLFPETLRIGAVPQHLSELMGREFFHEQR